MTTRIPVLPVLSAAVTALIFGAASPLSWADDDDDDDEIPFAEAHVFFELNNTDGDLGIHALIDGEPWKRLVIEDQRERKILDVKVKGRLRKQGLTEIFFESAEPPFDELAPAEFFARFPEGTYEIEGKTLDGQEMESETKITHVMPAPPNIMLKSPDMMEPIEVAEDCDADLPELSPPVIISWDEVTHSHPALGRKNEPIQVVNYEVVVEIDETPFKVSVILPPDVTEFMVPSEIIAIALNEGEDEVKFEVLVREASYNQTAVESCFVVI